MLSRLVILARLHLIARARNLDLVIDPRSDLSPSEAFTISCAYNLLRGVHVSAISQVQTFTDEAPSEPPEDGIYLLTTTFDVLIASQIACTLPVEVELRDYDSKFDAATKSLQLSPRKSSSTTVRFDPS
jgi:hypothetical protein